jgi:hypothetical protein
MSNYKDKNIAIIYDLSAEALAERHRMKVND